MVMGISPDDLIAVATLTGAATGRPLTAGPHAVADPRIDFVEIPTDRAALGQLYPLREFVGLFSARRGSLNGRSLRSPPANDLM
jgi:hypothetical protein